MAPLLNDSTTPEPKYHITATLNRGRWLVVVAAILWSLAGVFARLFQTPTVLGLETPQLEPMHLAMYRSIFAGLAMLFFLRGEKLRLTSRMFWMVICFALMNASYILALSFGKVSHAILLQSAAPLWVYLAGRIFLHEMGHHRDLRAILFGMTGIAALMIEGFVSEGASDWRVLLLGLWSGFMYSAIILFLRGMRHESSAWLTFLNHFGAGLIMATAMFLIIGPAEFISWAQVPTAKQLAVIAIWGTIQMAIPYLLFSKGMKIISAQEAGAIALIEPILNPIWAWMLAPEREKFTWVTWLAAVCILGGLAWRYWPSRSEIPNKTP
jgi:drug/metabolite transporter, DME family